MRDFMWTDIYLVNFRITKSYRSVNRVFFRLVFLGRNYYAVYETTDHRTWTTIRS